MLKARQLSDWHGCTFTQTALAHFIATGEFAKHTRRIHKEYAARRQQFISRLTTDLARWLEPIGPAAGIHLSARFITEVDETHLLDRAREQLLGLYSITPFFFDGTPQRGLVFGYGDIDSERINAGLDRVLELLQAPM